MCIPMTITPNTATAQAPQRPAPVDAEAIDNPERTSETADAVGRPDDQKKFPVIEDYWEARRRQRMLEMLRMQQGGQEAAGGVTGLTPYGGGNTGLARRRRGGTLGGLSSRGSGGG